MQTTTPTTAAPSAIAVIELTEADLVPHGAVACPLPRAGMPAWASHPHVYLHPDSNGRAQCPYCGNIYQLPKTPTPAQP